jgi:hypothetical protein
MCVAGPPPHKISASARRQRVPQIRRRPRGSALPPEDRHPLFLVRRNDGSRAPQPRRSRAYLLMPDAASDRAIDLAHDGVSCSPGPCQLRHRGDVEQGPASTPTLLMTWFAMLEGADAAAGRR